MGESGDLWIRGFLFAIFLIGCEDRGMSGGYGSSRVPLGFGSFGKEVVSLMEWA